MKIKIICFTLLFTSAFLACDREDLNQLYRMAEENEMMVKRLEETVVDMNDEIQNLHDLTRALMQRLYVTRDVEKSGNGYIITFGNDTNPDSIRIMVHDAHTPLLEIDPHTRRWLIDKEDTGVSAVGKDGDIVDNPQVRIGCDTCWEYSADGANWIKTSIKATGNKGADGESPKIAINPQGNWTIGGIETNPPVKAWGQNGENAPVPLIGIDSSAVSYTWKISMDGGINWQLTGVPCQAKNGTGGALANAPYIKQIQVNDDKITFTFSQNLPGTSTSTKTVTLKRTNLTISVPTSQLEYCTNSYYFLFGVNETRILNFNLTGTDIVSVTPVNLPDFLKAEVTINADKRGGQLKLTSGEDAAIYAIRNNFFQLFAVNANGEYATEVVRVSRVYKVSFPGGNQSYVYHAYGSGNEIVETWFKYNLYGAGSTSPAVGNYYQYAANLYGSYGRSITPYTTVTRPMLAKDIDGNEYRICRSPGLYWMIGNLKTTRYNDGSRIPSIVENSKWETTKEGACAYYDHDRTKAAQYGLLYNGYAVKTGKLCPRGWRVATDDDWLDIETWLNQLSSDASLRVNGWRGRYAGGRIKWNVGWDGGSATMNYLFPLEALPGGRRDIDGSFAGAADKGYWWTSTPHQNTATPGLYYRALERGYNEVYRNAYTLRDQNVGMSVRCVRDVSDVEL